MNKGLHHGERTARTIAPIAGVALGIVLMARMPGTGVQRTELGREDGAPHTEHDDPREEQAKGGGHEECKGSLLTRPLRGSPFTPRTSPLVTRPDIHHRSRYLSECIG